MEFITLNFDCNLNSYMMTKRTAKELHAALGKALTPGAPETDLCIEAPALNREEMVAYDPTLNWRVPLFKS